MKKYKKQELVRYIFDYCQELLTDEERFVYQEATVLRLIEKAESSKMKRKLFETLYSSDKKSLDLLERKETLELLEDGEELFRKKVVERILKDNPKKESLNVCKKCNYLARTPQAKQCRKCYYSWHHLFEL